MCDQSGTGYQIKYLCRYIRIIPTVVIPGFSNNSERDTTIYACLTGRIEVTVTFKEGLIKSDLPVAQGGAAKIDDCKALIL